MGRFRSMSFIGGENEKPAIEPVSFGIDAIDKELDGGLYPGLALIGGVPDMGQNDLLLTLAVTAARTNDEKRGMPVLLFSGEITRDIIRLRLVSRETADAAVQKGSSSGAVSTVLLLNGGGVQKKRDADEAREKLERECAENIYVVEGTNCDIITETGLFMKETGKKPLVAVYGIKSFRRGGEAMTTETNMSDLVAFLYGNSLCCAASCTLDKSSGDSIDRLAFRDSGVSCISADVLLAVIPSPTSRDRKASTDPRHVSLAVLKRSFGGAPGSRIPLDFRPKYSYIAQHKERIEKTRKLDCSYNNSDLSNNRVFRSTKFNKEGSEAFDTKWDEENASVTYRLYTDTGGDETEPITFDGGSSGNGLVFDYFELMLCDAVYTALSDKKRNELNLAFIYGILTGKRGKTESRITDERMTQLMQSVTRLALTKIRLEIKKTTDNTVNVIDRPLLPLDETQTAALREFYGEYRKGMSDALGEKERSKFFRDLLNGDRNGKRYIDPFINKENSRRYISLTDEMPLFEFAEKTGQIRHYPNELQYIPKAYRERSNENFLMVKHFLIKRLEWVRRAYSGSSPNRYTDIYNIWFLESSAKDRAAGLCSRIGYSKPDSLRSSDDVKQFRERFRQLHEMTKAILNYYTDIGYIYGFEDYYGKDGIRPGAGSKTDYNILFGVSLLPEDPDDPRKTYVRDPKTCLDWKIVDALLDDENNGKTSGENPDEDVKA